jgi:ribosomal protein S1
MNFSPGESGEEEKPTPEVESEKESPTGKTERKIKVYADSTKDDSGDERSEDSQDQAELMMGEMGGPKIYKIGDKVVGKVVQVKDDSLVVNIGTKNEGIVPREELSFVPNPSTEHYEPGDEIEMVVIRQADDDTYYLSKKRAEEEKAWQAVEEAYANGTRLKAVGSQVVNAGLILDMGIRGFMPLSHSDIKRIDVADLVGKEFEVKVLEYNKDARPQRLVVSRRACLEEDLTRERDKLYENFKPGDVVKGKVEKLTNFGAFINLGGVTGLLHISQMSRRRISDPGEVVKMGEEIDVKIIDIDREKRKIRLTRRELLPDPWDEIEKKYRPGDVVDGIVVRVTSFGAFVKIDNYFEGLAHISELVDNKINHAKEVFSPGDKVPVMILEIDTKRKRIRLSAKKAVEKQARSEVDAFLKDQEDITNKLRIPDEGLDVELAEPEPEKPPEPEIPPAPEEPAEAEEPAEVAEAPAPQVEAEAEPPTPEAPTEVAEAVTTSEPKVEEEPEVPGLDEAPDDTPPEKPVEPPVKTPTEPVAEKPPVEEPEPGEETKPAEEPPVETPPSIDADDDKELISGEEFDDTGKPDLSSDMNACSEADEIELVEGDDLEEK